VWLTNEKRDFVWQGIERMGLGAPMAAWNGRAGERVDELDLVRKASGRQIERIPKRSETAAPRSAA